MFSFSPNGQNSVKKSVNTINMEESGFNTNKNKNLQSTEYREYENIEFSKEEGDSPLNSIFNEAQSGIIIHKK